MRRTALIVFLCAGVCVLGAIASPQRLVKLPDCEWCGADEAPPLLSSEIIIAGPKEPGERLTITGVVYEKDGTTPAQNVTIYAYHTDKNGIYPQRGDETGNARRHGYLRGWVRTDKRGRYRINTIRPGSYPDSENPQHIHMTVKPLAGQEMLIDEIQFDDDPFLTAAHRARARNLGGSGIVKPKKNARGEWEAVRNITLPE